jgi:hypothetical protein
MVIPPSDPLAQKVMTISSSDYRMSHGFCIPIHGLSGYQAGISFAGFDVDDAKKANAALQLIGIYAFHRLGIGASRLQRIGKILEVPVAFFFEGAPDGWEGAGGDRTPNAFLSLLGTRDGQALVMSFAKIEDVTLRRSIVDLVGRLACLGGSDPPKVPRSRPKRT